ncbi:MAG: GTP pyrophosphokinase family protein, partial [Lachnospiraceae bacterium]|nr:GTP pyrophosphokinase family protein [Lachnospiraceae bacterium]
MKTDSIYGKYKEVLPQVMRTLTDAIIQFNWERVQTTGHPIYEHFNYRVKSDESMREKCTRRELPQTPESALLELKDSIGLRIITNFIDDIYKTAEFIRELPNVTVITEKDYIKNVKP